MKKINLLVISPYKELLTAYNTIFANKLNLYSIQNIEQLYEFKFINNIEIIIIDFKDKYDQYFSLLPEMKHFFKNKSLIVVIGYNYNEDILKAFKNFNVFRYIFRPLNYNDLKLTIEKAYEYIILYKEKEALINKLKKSNYILEEQKKLVINDFIKLKKLQQEIIEKEKLSSIGLLTSSIIHDIKNSLNIISGYTELIQMSNPELIKFTTKILNEINNLIVSLQDILNFSKGNKKFNYKLQVIDFNNFFEEIKNLLESFKIKFKYINFKVINNCNSNIKIKIDLFRIKRVLINIIKNGIEASFDREYPQISIKFDIFQKDVLENIKKKYLLISISDNGIGISKEKLQKIFHPFYSQNKKHGTGLGLTIAKDIIENHNGFIQLNSEKGKGTIFKIFLPIH